MKLVGKKLYRTGPLKLFNVSTAQMGTISNPSQYDTRKSSRGGGGGFGTGLGGADAIEIERRKKAMEALRKQQEREKWRKKLEGDEKADWRAEASRELYDPEQKAIFEKRKALAEGQAGALQQAGAERGLAAQLAAAGAGRGSSAARMRGMARAQEAGVRGAAALGAQSGAQQAQMLGQAGQGRFGMMKSDKAGKLGFFQKSRGLDVAEKAAQQQAAATRAANSGGKASGGQIFKEFKRKNGKIEGPGTETSDDIKAMLSDGEFVVNAKTVRGIGEAMGAKGKEDSRKKGAGFLYDLQTKYGDKKPVNKAFGGLELAELGAHAAKKGAFGKKMKTVGEVAGAAVDVKKGIDKKETDRVEKETSGFGKQLKGVDLAKLAEGGDVKLGKGVKAKRKFREAIGWEADKIFDKKAEKDYKEGHTGYKNYKGEKSVTPVKLGRGGLLGSIGRIGLGAVKGFVMGGGPTGAVMGAAKAGVDEKMAADKEKAQKKANIAMGEAEAAAKTGAAGKAMAADEIQLKKGGAVKKDHPHKAYLDELDKFMAHAFPKGKKVDLDPGRKADKAIKAKKGSIDPIEPYEFDKGGSVKSPDIKKVLRELKKWKSKSDKKQTEDFRKAKPHLRQRPKDWKKEKWQPEEKKLRDMTKFRKEEQEMSEADKRKAIRKSRALKDTGGDTKDLERIGREAIELKRRREAIKASDRGLVKKARKQEEEETAEARRVGTKRVHEGGKKILDLKRRKEAIKASDRGLIKKAQKQKEAFDEEDRAEARRKGMMKLHQADKEAKAAPEVSGWGKQLKGVDLAPKVKKEKSWWGDMPDKDKAGLIFGAGKGLLSARQQYLKDKQARRQRIAAGERLAGATRAAAGRSLISAPVSLRKGGRVSFKDVLKAKKKMGY